MASHPLALLFLDLILASAVLSSPIYDPTRFEFEVFKSKYGKLYSSDEEHDYRFKIFSDHLKYIERHNNDANNRFKLGINAFSDLTHLEFKSQRLIKMSPFVENTSFPRKHVVGDKNLPDSFDWTEHGVVQVIKDQGNCGSCWAFSAIAAIESAWAIKNNKLYSLSEQEVISCDISDYGCGGGLPVRAFEFFEDNYAYSENQFPYKADNFVCTLPGVADTKVKVADHFQVDGDEYAIRHALVEHGPLSALMYSREDFMHIASDGIYDTDDCPNESSYLNHAVVIVGYGSMVRSDGSTFKYWKVKNSWGSGWGNSGYVKMSRLFHGPGICGLYTMVVYPTVDKLPPTFN